ASGFHHVLRACSSRVHTRRSFLPSLKVSSSSSGRMKLPLRRTTRSRLHPSDFFAPEPSALPFTLLPATLPSDAATDGGESSFVASSLSSSSSPFSPFSPFGASRSTNTPASSWNQP